MAGNAAHLPTGARLVDLAVRVAQQVKVNLKVRTTRITF